MFAHAFCWESKMVSRNWRNNFCVSLGRSLTCSNFFCSCDFGPGFLLAVFGWLPNSSAIVTSRALAARSIKLSEGFGERVSSNQ